MGLGSNGTWHEHPCSEEKHNCACKIDMKWPFYEKKWNDSYHDLKDLSWGRSQWTLILLWNSYVSFLNLPEEVACQHEMLAIISTVIVFWLSEQQNPWGNIFKYTLYLWAAHSLLWWRIWAGAPSCQVWSYPEFSPSPHIFWFHWRSVAGKSWRWGWAESRGAPQVTWAQVTAISHNRCLWLKSFFSFISLWITLN